jgi:hypothetical protein
MDVAIVVFCAYHDYHLDCQDVRYVEDDMFREGVVCYLML